MCTHTHTKSHFVLDRCSNKLNAPALWKKVFVVQNCSTFPIAFTENPWLIVIISMSSFQSGGLPASYVFDSKFLYIHIISLIHTHTQWHIYTFMVNGKLSIAISARVAHFGWIVELDCLLTTVFDWVGRPLSSGQSHTGQQYNYKSQHFTTGFLLCVIYSRPAKRSLDTRESQVQLSDSSEHTRTLVLSKCRLISGDFKFDRVTDSKRKRSATRHCFRTTSFCGKDRFDTDTASERSRSPYLGETYTTRETHMHTRSNTLARRDGLSGWLVLAVCLLVFAVGLRIMFGACIPFAVDISRTAEGQRSANLRSTVVMD